MAVVAYGTAVTLWYVNHDRCVGLPKERIVEIARQHVIDNSALAGAGRYSESTIANARVAQFTDWHDPDYGYFVLFDIPTKGGRYLGVDVSGACACNLTWTDRIVPPI
jgi:hypothetical protein